MAHFDASDLNLSIDPKRLRPLFKTNPYRHALDMALNWLVIFATMYLAIQFLNPFTYILAILIIGARMHALAILMHDATHYRFLKNRKWNDLLSNVFTMYTIFSSIEKYRINHLRHHRHLNTEEDPDWVAKLTKREFIFPKTRQEFVLTVLSYFTMIQGAKDAVWFLKRFSAPAAKEQGKKSLDIVRIIFYLILFTTLTLTGWWLYYLAFWIVPYLTTFFMCQYIRSVAEHFGELAYDHLLNSTRTVKTNWLERFFLAPHNVGYHLEHHLYAAVPYYHLPELHKILMEDPIFKDKAHVTQGYLSGLMNELGSAHA